MKKLGLSPPINRVFPDFFSIKKVLKKTKRWIEFNRFQFKNNSLIFSEDRWLMNWKDKSHVLGFVRQTKGAVAVEFAVVLTLFLVLIAGAIDFGHAWFMQQVVTNASREGARYGITYRTDANGVRIAPNALTPTIANYVLTSAGYNITSLLPSGANPAVALAGAGYPTGTKGANVEVTVTATKTWLMVSKFVPGMGTSTTLTAKTVMLCE